MSAQHGLLNIPSHLANESSEENIPRNFSHSNYLTNPEQSGPLNPSHINPQNTGTIHSSNAPRFEPPPWPPTVAPQRHPPIDHNDLPPLPPTPTQPPLPYEHSAQPQISFEDAPLFPPPRPIPQQTRSVPNQLAQSLPTNSAVEAILQRLGHSTSSSQFTHRPNIQSAQQQSHQQPHQQPQQQQQQQQHQNRSLQQAHYLRQLYRSRLLGRQIHLQQQQNLSPLSPENMKEEELADWLQVTAGDVSEFSSPTFTHVHDPTVNLSTISPQDILSYPVSTPMSATLMSPFIDDDSTSYEVSPLFTGDDTIADGHWPSLFPEESPSDAFGTPYEQNMDADIDAILNSGTLEDPRGEDSVSPSASPHSGTPSSKSGRKGSVTGAGVRKRSAPLPPIVVEDPTDHVAIKRARNTLAARKSREKKVKKMEEMELQIEELKDQVEHWKRMYLLKGRVST